MSFSCSRICYIVLTKLLIQYDIEKALEAEIKTISVIPDRKKLAIRDHFNISYEHGFVKATNYFYTNTKG